ncbi:MAG: S8 family peptidase, partial [Halobacteria archaeon]
MFAVPTVGAGSDSKNIVYNTSQSGSQAVSIRDTSDDGGSESLRSNVSKQKVVIGYRNDVKPSTSLSSEYGYENIDQYRSEAVNFDKAELTERQIKRIRNNPKVSYVEKTKKFTGLGNTGETTDGDLSTNSQETSWGVDRINATVAEKHVPASAENSIQVAVLDTGVDYTHEDLNGTVKWGVNTLGSGVDYGKDAAMDGNGHGTGVAGIITANDNRRGVVGIAPNVSIYAVKVLTDQLTGNATTVAKGIEEAHKGPDGIKGTGDDADVISMSLGAPSGAVTVKRAVQNAAEEVAVVSAAGNSGDGDPSTNDVWYPAKYNGSMAIAASNQQDSTTTFSSEGRQVDVAAPYGVKTTRPGDEYSSIGGTSSATPHASGTAALILASQQEPGYGTSEIRERLVNSTVDIEDPGFDRKAGHGRINTEATVVPKHRYVLRGKEIFYPGNSGGKVGPAATVFQGEQNVTYRLDGLSVLETDTGETLEVDRSSVPKGQAKGVYWQDPGNEDGSVDGKGKNISVHQPRIPTFSLIDTDGNEVRGGASVGNNEVLVVTANPNYLRAEDVKIEVKGPSGSELQSSVVEQADISKLTREQNSTIRSSDGWNSRNLSNLTEVQQGVGNTNLSKSDDAVWVLDFNGTDPGQYNVTVEGTDDFESESNPVDSATSTKAVRLEPSGVVGETGSVDVSADGEWQHIQLKNTYDDPVVVTSPFTTYNGSDPAHTRVRAVKKDSFQVQVEEWNYLNEKHVTESVNYMVVEKGEHRLKDGTEIEAGTAKLDHNWKTVRFNHGYEDPVVFSQPVTYNGGQSVITRHRNVDGDGVDIRLQEEEGNNGVHRTEKVDYVATEGSTADTQSTDHNWGGLEVSTEVNADNGKTVFAETQTFNGNDPGAIRLNDRGQMFFEEERGVDNEVTHVTEDVGYSVMPENLEVNTSSTDTAVGEVGSVKVDAAGDWQKIRLQNDYEDPVVVTSPLTYRGWDPAHTRIKDVTKDSFRIQVEEWNYLNEKHATETVNYMVVENGSHSLDNGLHIEAGKTNSTHRWNDVNSTSPMSNKTVVLSQPMTYNGRDSVVTRQKNVGDDGFKLRLQEEEGNNGVHVSETVGYLTINGTKTTRLQMSTPGWRTVEDGDGELFADIQSFNGDNPAAVRMKNDERIKLEEERSADNEMRHVTEKVGAVK